MADVFVSYDRRDRDLAEKVVAALTEQGLTVWWDDRITPHETWDKTIEREVDNAKKVLVLWTKNSVESDWVRTEAGAAKEATPPKLIQARFSDCKVPLAFRLLQHVDLIGWTPKRRHSGWDRLVMWLKDGIDQPAVPSPGAGGPIPPEELSPVDAPVQADAAPAEASPPDAPAEAPSEPVVVPATMGLGNFAASAETTDEAAPPYGGGANQSKAEAPPYGGGAGAATGSTPSYGVESVDATTAEEGPVPVTMAPSGSTTDAGAPGGTKTGGIDKRLLIGGGIGLGVVVLVAAAMMLMSGGGSDFSDEEQTTLGGYLNGYAERYAQGLPQVGDDELARLADDAAYDYEVRLNGGNSYRVLGACDTNCRDVDIYVMDPSGQEIGRDILTDDFPVVEIPHAQDGTYTVRIGMPDCGTDTCIGAARVYQVD